MSWEADRERKKQLKGNRSEKQRARRGVKEWNRWGVGCLSVLVAVTNGRMVENYEGGRVEVGEKNNKADKAVPYFAVVDCTGRRDQTCTEGRRGCRVSNGSQWEKFAEGSKRG